MYNPVDSMMVFMTVYDFKPKFQSLLRPMCAYLFSIGCTANGVTSAALVLSVLFGLLVWFMPVNAILMLYPLVFLIRMALNAIDGILAREYQQKSALGTFLNEISDVVSDVALYLPFCSVLPSSAPLVIAVCFLAVLTEYAGVTSVLVSGNRCYAGPFGKSDRAVFFSVLAVLKVHGELLHLSLVGQSSTGMLLISGAVWVACILSMVTTVNRVRVSLVQAQEVSNGSH